MQPVYIIILALVLIILLLAIFTGVTCLFLSIFRRPASAHTVQRLQVKKEK